MSAARELSPVASLHICTVNRRSVGGKIPDIVGIMIVSYATIAIWLASMEIEFGGSCWGESGE